MKQVGKEVPGRKTDNADAIQSKVAPRMSSKTPGSPSKLSTNEDGFKDNSCCIEGILSSSVALCPELCYGLAECGVAKGVGVKAGGDLGEESSRACSGGNKSSVEEV